MPIAKVKLADGRIAELEVPEGISEQEIIDFAAKLPTNEYGVQARKLSTGEQLVTGFGGAMKGMGLGIGQRLGITDQQAVDEHRRQMEGLTSTPGGGAGAFFGLAAPAAATAAIPGANTFTGSALIGGAMGAAQPTTKDESALVNIGLGAGGGIVGKYVGDKLATSAANKFRRAQDKGIMDQQKNAVRDQTLRESQLAGYKQTPSQAGRKSIAESVSGKYKTEQALRLENQKVTDELARKSVGLSSTDNLSVGNLRTIRNKAYKQGYEPINKIGQITTDNDYLTAMSKIAQEHGGASRSFPNAADDEVNKAIDDLLVDGFDSGDAVEMVKNLRKRATDAFRQGKSNLGWANKKAAQAIEDQIERVLPDDELLANFRDARTLIAKTHSVEDALEESTGRVNAVKLGREFEKSPDRLSGDLKTIGKAGSAYSRTMKLPEAGDANPFTVFDLFGGGITAPLGYLAAGHPLGMALSMVPPASRVIAREYLKRVPAKAPSYAPSITDWILKMSLDNPATKAAIQGGSIGGLLSQ